MEKRNHCVQMNSFGSNIQTIWQELQKGEKFYDVTLACEDGQIQSHKIVLSSSSPIFKKILKSTTNPHPFIYLRGVKFVDLANLVTFMYQGEVDIAEQDFDQFLSTAEDLQIRGIYEDNQENSQFESHNNMDSGNEYTITEDIDIIYQNKNQVDQELEPKRSAVIVNQSKQVMKTENIDFSNKNQVDQEVEPKRSPILVNQSKQVSKSEYINSLKKTGLFSCDNCDKVFNYRHVLSRHEESVHKSVRYGCDQCDFNATRQYHLKAHIKRVHDGIHLALVNQSKQVSKSEYINSLNKTGLFSCDNCDKVFNYRHVLSRHAESVHKSVRYGCDQCDFSATQKYHLKAHIKRFHDGIPHACNQCKFIAQSKQYINRHIQKCHM